MLIRKIQLTSYRNYERAALSFGDKVNVFIGENAQGKTNLLEAIYVISLAKSHRSNKDKELIRFDDEFSRIHIEAENRTGQVELDLIISQKGKRGKINGLEQKRLSDYVGTINVVMFAPEDLELVKGSPQTRRRFIDMELGQISPVYLYELSHYGKIMKQRNVLLKTMQVKRSTDFTMLDILTEQMIERAAFIMKKRGEFTKQLEKWAVPIHDSISRGKEVLRLQYIPSLEVSEEGNLSKIKIDMQKKYEAKKAEEVRRGTTLFGPHRDDLAFTINDLDVQKFGSQGQQRTTALSLKLAEIDLIHDEVGEYPVLLLDDVLSELDDYRQSHLLETIQNRVQTFVTTTSISGLHESVRQEACIFTVNQGEIKRME
ncbi:MULTISPECIES: DNA replication/repair protein RecF [Shouchella]|uniref:DNA replication and repair protein RecF n=2 Tax=Shouchella TaxID=2893057 RepID=A0ABY7WBZ3_9BACI|nr:MULTISPECIES: DNA replication/repair protein RecF [Shouchella]MED4129871.1 DNA replication/repair protein RecF [Shouchella miscanthi]WDF05322.1 DNA replication/repair protein RecF [Shouchella hunanensis]